MSRVFFRVAGRPSWLVLPLSIVGLLLCFASASGHEIHVTAHVHGTSIEGKAYFQDKTPVSGARVTAFDPADQKIGETTTDEQGQFSLPAQFRCDYRLLLEVGDGHGAECLVHAEQLPAGLPTRGEAPHIHPHVETHSHAETPDHEQLEAIRSELAELRDQLADNEQALRLRGVLGGIGYIVGVAGIAMYLLGLRRQRS